jgi:hypothetical protein
VEAAPAALLEGEIDFSELTNLTETRTASLGEQISTTNLLTTDLDGEFTHVDQVIRLLADYDEVCEISRIPAPRLRLEIVSPDERQEDLRIASLWKELTVDGEIDPKRFEETLMILPESSEEGTPETDRDLLAFLKILSEDE